jgi:transposase
VNPGNLSQWHAKYAPELEACGENATVAELQSEVQRLRKQLRQAELEREILKKATAYFAKESQ